MEEHERTQVIGVVKDLATLNHDPGSHFWAALEGALLEEETDVKDGLSLRHVSSLITSLAVLGVPQGSSGLLTSLLSTALTAESWERGVVEQLSKAVLLLSTTGVAQPLMQELKQRLEENEAATSSADRPSAVSSSELHLRVVDALTGLGLCVETEVQHMGLNLDVVLWPSGEGGGRRPLVLEVDGPQHFLDRDPSRPTGLTISRRRLLSAPASPFAGMVPLIWLDFAGSNGTVGGGLVEVVEGRVREQGLSLADYRHPRVDVAAGEAEASWDLAKRLVKCSEEELVGLVEQEGGRLDVGHVAVLAQRVYGTARRQQGAGDEGLVRAVLDLVIRGVMEEGVNVPLHWLALLLRCLAFFHDHWRGKGEPALRERVFQRLVGRGAVSPAGSMPLLDPPNWAVPVILESMGQLGWRLGCSSLAPTESGSESLLAASPSAWRQLILAALSRVGDLDAVDLVRLIASLGSVGASRLLLLECSTSGEGPSVRAGLDALLVSMEAKVPQLRPHQLVDLVRGILQLGFTVKQPLEDAILRHAGEMAPSFSLEALAVVMIREPAIGDGETSLRAKRKAVQSRLGSEIRWRLRAMSAAALLRSMERLLARQQEDGFTSVSRGFLVMWASETFRRRSSLSKEQRNRVLKVMKDVQGVYDPGPGWKAKFIR